MLAQEDSSDDVCTDDTAVTPSADLSIVGLVLQKKSKLYQLGPVTHGLVNFEYVD